MINGSYDGEMRIYSSRDTVRVGLLEMRARELFAAKLATSSFIGAMP